MSECIPTPQEAQRRQAGKTFKRIRSWDEVATPAWATKKPKPANSKTKEVKNG